MIRTAIVVLLMLAFAQWAHAQEFERITIKAGQDPAQVLSYYGMYRFPEFTNGAVVFRNGNTGSAKLNYNVYLGLIQFIDNKGDTLAIKDPETIDSVYIGTSLFFYQNAYLQVITAAPGCKLVMQQKIEFRPAKLGAFGTPSEGFSVQEFESLPTDIVKHQQLILNEDMLVFKKNIYYLLYKKNQKEDATLQGFLEVYPSYKEQIETFVKTNKTDFKKSADLQNLMAFCNSLKLKQTQ